MKISTTARKKLADKSVSWEEVYTPDTAYFKTMYDNVVGEGSYFRFEGKDSETGNWHMVVVGPAKMHDPEAKFFAGQRKLPATYSASGEYFSDMRAALNHANEHWGISIPSEANLSLSSSDLKNLGDKADKWREDNKKDDVIAKFDKTITDPKNDPKSASTDIGLQKLALRGTFRKRPPSRYFDLDELDKKLPDDWDVLVAAWPNLPIELEYARGVRDDLRAELMRRYGDKGADPNMHKMFMCNSTELDSKGNPWGTHLVSIGPYVGRRYNLAVNTFCPYTHPIQLTRPEDLQKTLASRINHYYEMYNVQLTAEDFSMPTDRVGDMFCEHYCNLNASGKDKILGNVADQLGFNREERGWKTGLEQVLEENQREYMRRQNSAINANTASSKEINSFITKAWEDWRAARARGENLPKPPVLDVRKWSNDRKLVGAQGFSGIIKYPAFKVVGELQDGSNTILVEASAPGQSLKRIGNGSRIRLVTYEDNGSYRYGKDEFIVDSFEPSENGSQGTIRIRSPLTRGKLYLPKNPEKPWFSSWLIEVTRRIEVINGQTVDWGLKDVELAEQLKWDKARVREVRQASEASNYGFNNMQASVDFGSNSQKHIPKGMDAIVISENFTSEQLNNFANVRAEEFSDAKPSKKDATIPASQRSEKVPTSTINQGVQGVGAVPSGQTPVPEQAKVLEQAPATEQTPAPEKAIEQPVEEKKVDIEEILKQRRQKKMFSQTINEITSIAEALDKGGKSEAAEEVNWLLRKYL